MIESLSSKLEKPRKDNRLQIFTEGNDDYTYILSLHFDVDLIDYGQLVKIRENGILIRKEKKIIYGNPDFEDIETTNVENDNGIFRERVGRLVRETKCFSKKRKRLVCAVTLFQFYWNFINKFKINISPGMMEGLTDRIWSWNELFHYHISSPN